MVLLPAGGAAAQDANRESAQVALHIVQQETAIAGILKDLGDHAAHGTIVFRNVRVVDAVAETSRSGQTVVVSNSRIGWVGENGKEPALDHATVIDGGGHFLSPGLVDMHVHSRSVANWLLELDNGITAVRDMDGFPWMLRFRDSVSARKILAPVDYVAGTIINTSPLEGYAVVPRDGLDARRIVRQQSACGYDFIKVHNNARKPVFDAIADQAAKVGMDLVGHVPHDMTVRYAIGHGMRTMEHLKGFLDDRTLQIGDTDYAAVVDGPDVWNTPTLYVNRSYARGAEAHAMLANPEMRFVPTRDRLAWRTLADQPEDASSRLGKAATANMRQIVGKLAAQHARFLAGTDADDYPFTVMGFALVSELHLLEEAGLSPAEAMRAATIEPARAMRLGDEFGSIKPGLRADLVLLEHDPLKGSSAFDANLGVMAHGYWVSRKELNDAQDRLAAIYAEPDTTTSVDQKSIDQAYLDMKSKVDTGFVFDSRKLTTLATTLRALNLASAAKQFDDLADIPTGAPCAEVLPE